MKGPSVTAIAEEVGWCVRACVCLLADLTGEQKERRKFAEPVALNRVCIRVKQQRDEGQSLQLALRPLSRDTNLPAVAQAKSETAAHPSEFIPSHSPGANAGAVFRSPYSPVARRVVMATTTTTTRVIIVTISQPFPRASCLAGNSSLASHSPFPVPIVRSNVC